VKLAVAVVRRWNQERPTLPKEQQDLALAGLQSAPTISEIADNRKSEDPLVKPGRSRHIVYIE
jgi:hypothetical protein